MRAVISELLLLDRCCCRWRRWWLLLLMPCSSGIGCLWTSGGSSHGTSTLGMTMSEIHSGPLLLERGGAAAAAAAVVGEIVFFSTWGWWFVAFVSIMKPVFLSQRAS